jgi:hypothetical protein
MLNSERLMELKDLHYVKTDLLSKLDPECPAMYEEDPHERVKMRLEIERIQARINLLSRARGANQ